MEKKNPWATEYGRPPIERDVNGETSDEEQKLYDGWERDFETQKAIHKNYPNLNQSFEDRVEFHKLKK